MALAADFNPARRGLPGRNEFGYPVPAGEMIYLGSLLVLNSAGGVQRVQTAGGVAFAGLSDRNLNNTANAAVSTTDAVARKGTYALVVPSATPANVNAPVYATDDATLTLAQPGSGFTAAVGTLVGIENGQTYVMLAGS